MTFELTGKVIDIQQINNISDKFRKREFVIETTEAGSSTVFVNYVKFQLVQDKCDLIDDSFMNEEVKVSFNIKGNKWERDGKTSYFTNLDVWRIEKVQNRQSPVNQDYNGQDAPQNTVADNNDGSNFPPNIVTDDYGNDDMGDLPF